MEVKVPRLVGVPIGTWRGVETRTYCSVQIRSGRATICGEIVGQCCVVTGD